MFTSSTSRKRLSIYLSLSTAQTIDDINTVRKDGNDKNNAKISRALILY
jgi:hypothetical protein